VRRGRDTRHSRVTPEVIAYHAARARRLRLRAYRQALRMALAAMTRALRRIRS